MIHDYCHTGWLKCQDGLNCIPERYICDADSDCKDGSDENSTLCASWNCTAGYWKCQKGVKCIDDLNVCDGQQGCEENEDEYPSMCAQRKYAFWTCKPVVIDRI